MSHGACTCRVGVVIAVSELAPLAPVAGVVAACGTRDAARALAAAGIDTYLYLFEFEDHPFYRDPSSLSCTLTSEFLCGVFHATDLIYVFQHPLVGKGKAMAETFGKYWTNFAKTGSPNGDGLVTWPKYRAGEGYTHIVLADKVSTVSNDYRNDTCNFWDSIPKEAPYNEP
jgi:para-nitrobenzyl esterase